MAFTLSQPSYGQAGSYTAVQDRTLIKANVVSAGVRNMPAAIAGTSAMQGDLAVTTNVTPASTVAVAAGDVWIDGGSGQGFYYAYNDAAINSSAFASNSSGNPRIDLVVVQVTDTGSAAPSIAVTLVQGTAAVSPTPPATPAKALALAQVRIPNGFVSGTTAVIASNITDVRPKVQLWNMNVPSTATITTPVVGNLVHDGLLGNQQSYNSLSYIGTSTTSLTVSTASKTFTTQSGLSFAANQRVRAYSSSSYQNYVAGTTTSVTSNTIGTGSKTFTVGSGLAYIVGTRVRIYQTTTSTNFMEGAVTSYSSTTLIVNVDATGGAGTIAAWTVIPIIAYMEGTVTSYSTTTLVVSMDTTNGGGTATNPSFTDWWLFGPAWEQPVKAETSGSYDNRYRYVPTVVAPSTVSPSLPVEGGMWYQTDTDRLLSYTGTSWQRIAYNGASGRTGGRWSIPLATPQSFTTGTAAFMSWTTEAADSDGFLAIPSTTFTVPAGMDGQYVVSCSLIWSGDPTGNVAAPNSNNASTLIVWNIGAVEYTTNAEVSKGSVYSNRTGVTGFATLAAGDSFQIRARQVSGGTLTAYGILNVARIGV